MTLATLYALDMKLMSAGQEYDIGTVSELNFTVQNSYSTAGYKMRTCGPAKV